MQESFPELRDIKVPHLLDVTVLARLHGSRLESVRKEILQSYPSSDARYDSARIVKREQRPPMVPNEVSMMCDSSFRISGSSGRLSATEL